MGNVYLMRQERECNKKFFFFLHVSYSTHLKIDVHCSCGAKSFLDVYCSCGAKSFRFSSTVA